MTTNNQNFVISYLTLRKAVGILGMLLPLVLSLGFLFIGSGCVFPPSISHFYYTNMGNYFVGTLCAVSLFMFAYNGPGNHDKLAAKAAGLFALLVVMFPTNFNYDIAGCSRISSVDQVWMKYIHYGAATLLFLTFACFCLCLFTKTNINSSMTRQKKIRNDIYRTCGWVIIVCIAGIPCFEFIKPLQERFNDCKPTFVFETLALLAFGFSWLIKGETFFKDK